MESKKDIQNRIKDEVRRQQLKRMIISTADPAKYMNLDFSGMKEGTDHGPLVVKNHFSSFRRGPGHKRI